MLTCLARRIVPSSVTLLVFEAAAAAAAAAAAPVAATAVAELAVDFKKLPSMRRVSLLERPC